MVKLFTLLLLALSTVIIKGQDTPNEPFLSKQWYLQNEQEHSLNAYQDADIDGVEAWEFSTDHPNMKITIIKGQEGVADKLNPELVSSISTKNTEISKGIIVGIWGGVKLPENNPKTNSGPWGGVFVNMHTGLGWSLQLEYNVWRTILVNRTPEMVAYSPGWNFLIAHEWFFNNAYLKPLIGTGIVSSGESWFGGDRDFLVSFNLAINIGLILSNEIDGFLQIRKQWAGSLSAGGGASYTPWLIGFGLQLKLN